MPLMIKRQVAASRIYEFGLSPCSEFRMTIGKMKNVRRKMVGTIVSFQIAVAIGAGDVGEPAEIIATMLFVALDAPRRFSPPVRYCATGAVNDVRHRDTQYICRH